MLIETTRGTDRNDKAEPQGRRGTGPDGRFFTTVNGATVKFSEAKPTGRQILEAAPDLRPSDDYVLIQLLGYTARSIGLDEEVDLQASATETFRAFKSDRVFRFTLNGHGFDWGMAKIAEPELRAIARVPQDEAIVLHREGEPLDLGAGDVLDLAARGTEHLHTENRLITVYYENHPREIARGVYTTEKLKDIFGVQAGYILEYINEEGRLTELKTGEKLHVKDGMKFFEQVPCGGSS